MIGYFKKTLIMLAAVMLAMSFNSCDDDDSGSNSPKSNPDGNTISKTEAVDAMVKILEQRNLALRVTQTNKRNESGNSGSDGPKTRDYVSTEVDNDGDRTIKLNIGPDGNLIPSSKWQAANAGFCKASDRFMKAPVKQLVFKVFSLPDSKVFSSTDSYDAFVQYIDVATGKIEEQREGEAASLDKAMNKAWNKLQKPVGQAVGPCGKKRGFKLTYSADIKLEVVEDGVTTIKEESVKASIPLTYNKDRQFFEGNGKLKWDQFNLSTSSSTVTFDCQTPPDAEVNVIFKAGPEGTPTDSMEGSIEFYNLEQAPCNATTNGTTVSSPTTSILQTIWLTLHKNEANPTLSYPDNPARKIGYFTMKDWQAVSNNEQIIAKKTYDQSFVEDTGTWTESATLKFTR